MDAFLTGVVAGFGIAIPVGAISVLIVETGIRRGFGPAFAAGAGAATADLVYAALAAVGGAALAAGIESLEAQFRVLSGLVLLGIAVSGLVRARRARGGAAEGQPVERDLGRVYARFLGLTLINPTTVVYFAAVIIGLGVAVGMTASDGLLFVVGAFLASFSWQTLIATVGTAVGRKLRPDWQRAVSVLGNLVILGFGLFILFR